MKNYYFNTNPKHFGVNDVVDKEVFGHLTLRGVESIFITPAQFTKKHISPEHILGLKKKYKIENIIMFDRVLGAKKNILITDHINRSGISFIIGKTPHKKLPMFPDMSEIYIKNTKNKSQTVQTLGPKSYKNPPGETGIIFSEASAITATLWHYVGVSVKCYGIIDNSAAPNNPLEPL